MLRYLFLGCSLTISLAFVPNLGISSVYAQTEDSPYPSNERDSFSSELGEGLNPFDLIHRSNFSRGRSLKDYRIEQQQNLNDAASQFRQQQQQLLQQQSENTPEETDSPAEAL